MPLWLRLMPIGLRSKLAHRNNLLEILHNSGWLFVDKFIRMGVGLFVSIWLARYLGPEQFGLWNYALAFTGLFGAFSTLGLDGIVVRMLVKEPDKINEILGSAFGLKVMGALFAVATSLVAISLMRSEDALTIWLVGISSFGFVLQAVGVIDCYFQSKVQSKYTVIAANIAFLIMAAMKVIFILNKSPLIAFAWTGLAEIFTSMTFLIFFYRSQKQHILNWHFSVKMSKKLLYDSWPLVISGIAITIYMKIDQLAIAKILGNTELGIYLVAVRVFEIFLVVPSLISQSIYPKLMILKKNDFNKKVSTFYFYITRFSLLATVLVMFFSEKIINLIYGNAFSRASEVLTLIMFALTFTSLGIVNSLYIYYYNLQRFVTLVTILGAALNLVLCFSMIKLFGLSGAVYSTVITYVFINYLVFLFIPNFKPMFNIINKSVLRLNVSGL
jgi:PST family polysaccharide transporter